MRAVLQRAARGAVRVQGEVVGEIGRGAVVLVAVERGDTSDDVERMADRIRHLRYFEDGEGRMNFDVVQAGGRVLLVSQFTLAASTRKGRRPSFSPAEDPEVAAQRLDELAHRLGELGVEVACGRFGARMEVELVNDGPVTLLVDTRAARAAGSAPRGASVRGS